MSSPTNSSNYQTIANNKQTELDDVNSEIAVNEHEIIQVSVDRATEETRKDFCDEFREAVKEAREVAIEANEKIRKLFCRLIPGDCFEKAPLRLKLDPPTTPPREVLIYAAENAHNIKKKLLIKAEKLAAKRLEILSTFYTNESIVVTPKENTALERQLGAENEKLRMEIQSLRQSQRTDYRNQVDKTAIYKVGQAVRAGLMEASKCRRVFRDFANVRGEPDVEIIKIGKRRAHDGHPEADFSLLRLGTCTSIDSVIYDMYRTDEEDAKHLPVGLGNGHWVAWYTARATMYMCWANTECTPDVHLQNLFNAIDTRVEACLASHLENCSGNWAAAWERFNNDSQVKEGIDSLGRAVDDFSKKARKTFDL